MAIRNLLHTCTVYRRQQIAGKGLSAKYAVIAENVKCLAMPQTAQNNIQQNITVGQDFVVLTNIDADIKEGDKLVVSTGVNLYVSGEAIYKDFPRIEHKEFNCQTTKD